MIDRSRSMFSLRKLIVFVCLVAVLLVATAPTASALFNACLVTLIFCSCLQLIAAVHSETEGRFLPQSGWTTILGSRAPPAA